MNCKKSKKLLLDYMENSLADERRAAVESHLSQCERCRAELSQLERLKKDLQSLETPEQGTEFWEHFNARLAQKLASEEVSTTGHGLRSGTLLGQPRFALAAGLMTILLVALLAVAGLVISQNTNKPETTIPDIALDSREMATIDIKNMEVEFFLKNGTNGTDLTLSDVSDDEMESIEDEIMSLMEEDLASASEDMVPDDIYEETVYDLLDELSYEEIEQVYKKLGLS
jgi:hypothetical protein